MTMTKRSHPPSRPEFVPELHEAPRRPHIEAIEATLEPPEEDELHGRNGNGAPRDTVIINSVPKPPESERGQYLMVRPERQVPAYLLVCMGANVGHRYPIGTTELVIGRSERCD